MGIPFSAVGFWHPTAKNFIHGPLNSDPARCLTAEQALARSWLTSFAAPTEHDLSGQRENLTSVRAGVTRPTPSRSCRSSRIIRVRITTRTSRWSAPTMKMTTEAAGRHRGARRQIRAPRDTNNTCRRRRRTIAYRGVGWQYSWRRGQQGQQRPRRRRFRCRHRPQCRFRLR